MHIQTAYIYTHTFDSFALYPAPLVPRVLAFLAIISNNPSSSQVQPAVKSRKQRPK
jgi:hypothetical protein